jgi:hypothetical protein
MNGITMAAEPFVEGSYVKHSNNYGWVDEEGRNTPQAFSHFTFEQSGHKVMIVDIQGVHDFYTGKLPPIYPLSSSLNIHCVFGCVTDPQVHTHNGQGFGLGNLGVHGIKRFLQTHQCSAVCRALGLELLDNQRPTDHGTQAVQRPQNVNRGGPPTPQLVITIDTDDWLRSRFVDPAAASWSFSSVTFKPHDMGVLVHAARHRRDTLTAISLCGCHLLDEEASELMAVLTDLPRMSYLNLAGNQLTDAACFAVDDALRRCLPRPSLLRTLELGENRMTFDGLRRVIAEAASHEGDHVLEMLTVSNNLLTEDQTAQLAALVPDGRDLLIL